MVGVQQVSNNNKNNPIRIRISVLMRNEEGQICFVRHRKNDRLYWLLPGGGQDPMESALDTAKRELYEELRIKIKDLRFLFIRESMNPIIDRHIQFLVFEALNPDYSKMETGEDPRVDGFDFFSINEIRNKTIYPAMHEDLIKFGQNEQIKQFKTLDWIP
ncbi:MAG: NUDIX domain-containing protein [Candidatus Rifleibacteriota bacterium]